MNITIHRSWFIYVATAVVGLGIAFGLWCVASAALAAHELSLSLFWILAAVGLVVAALTALQVYLLSLSSIVLTDANITATNWTTLFSDTDVVTEWNKVQDVTAQTGGIFAQLFGYGTLIIQTAGTAQNIRMAYVPTPEYWQQTIQAKVDVSPILTKSV